MLYFFKDGVLFCMENTKLLAYFILLRIFAHFGVLLIDLNDAVAILVCSELRKHTLNWFHIIDNSATP